MSSANSDDKMRFWAGQLLPWLTVLALGGWYASKMDSRQQATENRVATLESWRMTSEAARQQETTQKINDLQETIREQTDEIKRLRGAVNAR